MTLLEELGQRRGHEREREREKTEYLSALYEALFIDLEFHGPVKHGRSPLRRVRMECRAAQRFGIAKALALCTADARLSTLKTLEKADSRAERPR